jgi:hypothetical protein
MTIPTDSKLEKIAKLLRMAERSKNMDESAAFMAKAQELASEHSIDLTLARQHAAKDEKAPARIPEVRNIRLGKAGTKGLFTLVTLMTGIANANDVRCNIAHDSTYLICFGFSEDLDMCERFLEFLLPQMQRDWLVYKRSDQYVTDQYSRQDRWSWSNSWDRKPVSGLTLRLSFQEGWANTISRRMRAAALDKRMERIAADTPAPNTSSSTELAIRNKELEVADFYKRRSNARGIYRGGASFSSHSGAYGSGRSAAEKARLGGERAISSTSHNKGAIR